MADSIVEKVVRVRATFDSGVTRTLGWRRAQLEAIRNMMVEEERAFLGALATDMGRGFVEGITTDINIVKHEAEYALRHLRKWMKSEKVRHLPLMSGFGTSAEIVHEPLGVALIIGAWNYPIMLTVAPLVHAIAAGNVAVLKPSELSVASADAIEQAVRRHLDSDVVAVVQGGVPETTELLEQRFDSIFFTGSRSVGAIVMQAAAKHVTPVVLELGGKSPAIVNADADLEVTARRITQGKFFNAGQTCLAVDYVLAHEEIYEDLLTRLEAETRKFYGIDPLKSPDYARIINRAHFERLCELIANQKVVIGGQWDESERYISPTILRDVGLESRVMREEIFGPILPVIPMAGIDAAVDLVNSNPKPLALYIFAKDRKTAWGVIRRTSSGGSCINDTLTHVANTLLPFGGVGESGFGAYHGYDGYLTFTHRRSVLTRTTILDPSARYPPFSKWKQRFLSKMR